MATDYAPLNMVRAGKEAAKEIPGCTFSGVLGDRAHTYGYHRGRNVLPKSDYSVRISLDKLGPSGAASALDLKFTASQMKVVTARLRKSALDTSDPRLECVREFYGTLNGRTVFGLIKNDLDGPWRSSTSDSSHLWHIHISFFRKFANDYAALRRVVDVMKGIPWRKVTTVPVANSKPTSTPRPAGPTTHKVVRGDTLSGLSKRYGIPVETLKSLNNIPPSNIIRVGSVLKLKSSVPAAPVKEVNIPVAVDPSEKYRPVWGVKYKKYYENQDGEREWSTVANTLFEIDARLKRIEDKLNEGGNDEGSNTPAI